MSPGQVRQAIATLPDETARALLYDWKGVWAREQQLPPVWAWVIWLILAGRGYGKTRTGAEWVRDRVESGQGKRLIIAGPTSDDIRDIMIEGESGLLAVSPPWNKPLYLANKSQVVWPKCGAKALCITAEKPDRFRGKQCDSFWADELASWRYPDAWTQLQLGFRLGSNPQGIVTTTPRPTPLIKALVARGGQDVALTKGTTYDNRANLAKQFLEQIIREYEGTRLGRQELEAEILEDNPNALWVRTRIDDLRVMSRENLPQMRRVVVAIDPAVSTNPKSNETGIIVVGLGEDGHAYVLDDLSGVYSPAQWAARALEAFDRWEADYIVGEVNNGGDLVERNVQVERDDAPPFKSVHASRGKAVRADPISTLYEQGRVHHLGMLGRLEDQMCGWDPANDETSPDRVDALVWGISFLDVNKKLQDYDGIRRGRRSARGR